MSFIKQALYGAIFGLGTTFQASAQSEKCSDPTAHADKDIQRNQASISSNPNLCLSEIKFQENGLNWELTILENSKYDKGPTIFLLHDNENSAFDTALYSITKYGGKIVSVEAREKRIFAGVQDPNRNFGVSPAQTKACRDMRTKPAPMFTKILQDLRSTRANFFLTLHNNANGHTGNGGGGAISADRNSSVMNGMRAPSGGDEDDAILLASTKAPGEDLKLNKAVKYFHQAGINVIYEYVRPENNDCSFSNFVVLNKLGQYFNIEAQHGHTAQQKQMLDVLMKYQRVRARK